MLAKARREMFGQSSERSKLLVEQLELAIEDLEETQAEEETKAEIAAPAPPEDRRARHRQRGPRRTPTICLVERIVEPAPCACGKCGGARLRKLGEEVSKTLECDPRRWKIVEHVREKITCRDCEGITEPPAPSHPIARGRAGPSLLAMILACEVSFASAIEPAERDLCARRRRNRRLHACRLGGGERRDARSDHRGDPASCLFRRTPPCRRYDRARAGETEDGYRPNLDLCPRRPALRRRRSAGGAFRLFANAIRRFSARTSLWLGRRDAELTPRRIQRTL